MSEYNIGVYAGNRVVKCIAIDKQKENKSVHCKETYYFDNTIKMDEDYIAWVHGCIGKFIRTNKIRKYKVYMAYDIDSFILEVNNLSDKEIEQSLVYQIQEKLNIYDMKNIKYSWTFTENKETTHLAAISVIKNDIYEKFTNETLVSSIEDTNTSIARLIPDDKDPIIALDMQRSNISIILFMHGTPVYSNSMRVDTKDFNLSSNYLLKYAFDTTNVKNEFAKDEKVSENNEESIFETNVKDIEFDKQAMELEPVVTEISNFIRTSVFSIQVYLEGKSIQYQVDKLYYTYDASLYGDLIRYIVKSSDMEYIPLLLLKDVGEQYEISSENIAEYTGYELPIGLAEVGKDKFSLSDLPFYRKNHTAELLLTRLNIGMVAGLLVILAALTYYNGVFSNTNKEAQAEVANLSNILNTKQAELSQYQLPNGSELQMDALLTNLTKLKNYNLDILARLQESVVNSVELTDVEINDNLTISGVSANYSDIAYSALELQRTYKVNIDSIDTKKVNGLYNFKMEVNLGRADYNTGYSIENIFGIPDNSVTTEETTQTTEQNNANATANTPEQGNTGTNNADAK